MNAKTNAHRRQSAAVTPYVVISIVAFFALAALATDGGFAWNTRNQTQNAADGAALAGAHELIKNNGLTLDKAGALTAAQTISQQHTAAGVNVVLPPGGLIDNGAGATTFVSGGRTGTLTLIATAGVLQGFKQFTIEGDTVGAATGITVSLSDDTVALGQNILATANVTNTDGDPVGGVLVRFTDNPTVASVDSNVKTTNSSGEATAIFTADELGTRAVTATVVNLIDGIIVESALSSSASVTVAAVGASGLTSTSGFSAWVSEADTTSAELLAALDGPTGIYKAVGSGFILYAVTSGGSVLGENYDITFGDVLFISG